MRRIREGYAADLSRLAQIWSRGRGAWARVDGVSCSLIGSVGGRVCSGDPLFRGSLRLPGYRGTHPGRPIARQRGQNSARMPRERGMRRRQPTGGAGRQREPASREITTTARRAAKPQRHPGGRRRRTPDKRNL